MPSKELTNLIVVVATIINAIANVTGSITDALAFVNPTPRIILIAAIAKQRL